MSRPPTLSQPLGQTDALILQCLERVDGRSPIEARTLLVQVNVFELSEVGIGFDPLLLRLVELERAGLVKLTKLYGQLYVKITPAALDLLAGDRGSTA